MSRKLRTSGNSDVHCSNDNKIEMTNDKWKRSKHAKRNGEFNVFPIVVGFSIITIFVFSARSLKFKVGRRPVDFHRIVFENLAE